MATSPSVDSALQSLSLTSTTLTASHTSALQTLATASRSHPSIRPKLGQPQILRALIKTLDLSLQTTPSFETADLALRCIANACADNHSARDEIVKFGFEWALLSLNSRDEEIRLLTIKVLYNICTDHEDAQKACYEQKVHYEILRFCASEEGEEIVKKLGEEESAIIGEVLFLISGQKATLEPTLREPLPMDILDVLLGLPRLLKKNLDIETNATNVEIVVVFLRDVTVQGQMIVEKRVADVRLLLQDHEMLVAMLKGQQHEEDDIRLLTPLSASFVWCLSDIAANTNFTKQYSLEDRFFHDVVDNISEAGGGTAAGGPTLTADCHLLTNLLWASPSDSYVALAENVQLQAALLQRIAHCEAGVLDMDALHAMAGLLIMLARPSLQARETIGSSCDAQEALQRLCRHENVEIKKDGVKLIKALGSECPENQRRFAELAKEAILSIQAENSNNEAPGSSLPG